MRTYRQHRHKALQYRRRYGKSAPLYRFFEQYQPALQYIRFHRRLLNTRFQPGLKLRYQTR